MTDEQIKQNAEAYADSIYDRKFQNSLWKDKYYAYLKGAHSRDEEIKDLRLAYNNLVNSFCERGRELAKASQELDQLRNPWISVEEKMPPIKTRVLFLDNNGKAWLGKNTISGYAELESDQPEILPPPTVPTCKPIITHWMPIPELKG